jgi:DNA (cytosine-5)-methyltransferase 1
MAVPKLTAIDLFAGCGGVTQGLKQAGFRVVAAIEINPLAAGSYRLNHSEVRLVTSDIRSVDGRKLMTALGIRSGELDLLVGCPPCQGFSTLRTRNGASWNKDPRNNLVDEMLRLIRELRPRAVMMENVPKLGEKQVFKDFVKALRLLRYAVAKEVVDVQDFGVPQRRRRLVLIAGKRLALPFPPRARKRRTVRDTISCLKPAGASGDRLHDLPETRSPKVAKRIAQVPKDGGSRSSWPKKLRLKCHGGGFDGFKDVYGRMAWDDVAPTMTGGCFNPSKGRFLHPAENRNITMREAALLQTFPARYKFDLAAGKQGVALMIGNALPPELVRRQGIVIRRALSLNGRGGPGDKKRNRRKALKGIN